MAKLDLRVFYGQPQQKEDKMKKIYQMLTIMCTVTFLVAGIGGEANCKELVFGWTAHHMAPAYARAMLRGAEIEAKDLGIKILVKNAKFDVVKQLAQLDSLLEAGVDGLLFFATNDTKAIIPAIKKFNEKRIPIIALDNAPEGGFVDYWISFDVKDSSKKAAEYFIKGIKEKHKGQIPKGVVIEITGVLPNAFFSECIEGFRSVVDEYKQLKVVQAQGKCNNTGSFEATSDLLKRYGDRVVGIYVDTPDIMAPGVVRAVEEAGLDPAKFSISGICMGPEGRDLIKEGKAYCIISQPTLEPGKMAVRYLYDLLNSKPTPKEGDIITKEGVLWAPAKVIKNPRSEGLWIKLNAPAVPFQVKPDDPRLWENILTK